MTSTTGGFNRRRRANTRATRSSSFASTTMYWEPLTEEGGSHSQGPVSHLAVQEGQVPTLLDPVQSYDPSLTAEEEQGSDVEPAVQSSREVRVSAVSAVHAGTAPSFVLLPPPLLQPETSIASYHTAADETEQEQGVLGSHSQQQGTIGVMAHDSSGRQDPAAPRQQSGVVLVGPDMDSGMSQQQHNKRVSGSNGLAPRASGALVVQPAGVVPSVQPLGVAFSPLSVLDTLYETPPSHPGGWLNWVGAAILQT
jgi:hypothetical protein